MGPLADLRVFNDEGIEDLAP